MTTYPITQKFTPGPRLIDGSDLNTLVDQVNAEFLAQDEGNTFTNATINTSTIINSTISSGTLTNVINNGNAQCTASLAALSATTLANITGLSVTVTAGGVYNFRAMLVGTASAAGGIKAAMSGTAIMSSANITGFNYDQQTLNAVQNTTTWGSTVAYATTTYSNITIEGGFTCQTAGTVTVQAAQSVSTSASATTVLPGSNLTVGRVS